MFVGKGHGVTNARGHLQVLVLVRLEENYVALHAGVRGIHVAEDLRARGLGQLFGAVDIQPRAQLLALVTVENAERVTDAGAQRLVGVGVGDRTIVRIPRAEGRIARAVGDGKLVIRLGFVDGLDRRLQVRPRVDCRLPNLVKSRDRCGKVVGAGNVKLVDGRPVVQEREKLDFGGLQTLYRVLQIGFIGDAL